MSYFRAVKIAPRSTRNGLTNAFDVQILFVIRSITALDMKASASTKWIAACMSDNLRLLLDSVGQRYYVSSELLICWVLNTKFLMLPHRCFLCSLNINVHFLYVRASCCLKPSPIWQMLLFPPDCFQNWWRALSLLKYWKQRVLTRLLWRTFALSATCPHYQNCWNGWLSLDWNHVDCSLSNWNILQSAYSQGHSTETALCRILDDIIEAADVGHITALVSLDISAAFDVVDHVILIQRLEEEFGITDTCRNWIMSYLTGRSATVRVGSLSCCVPHGVPQG